MPPGTTLLRFGQDEFRAWEESFCDREWGVDTRKEARAPFSARLDIHRIGRATLHGVSVGGGGTALGRSRRRVSERPGVGVALSVVERGRSVVHLEGRQHELAAGDVSLLTDQDVFEKRMCSDEYREQLLVVGEGDVVALAGRRVERRGPVVAVRGGLAPVLGDFVGALAARRPHDASARGLDALVRSLLVLVAEVFEGRGEPAAAAESGHAYQRTRIQRFIDDHLGEPELGPRLIAERNRMSLRYLHKLYEGTGETVAAAILSRRLERCHADLVDPSLAHVGVGEVAFSWGFSNASYFSRVFRARYGTSPHDARAGSAPRAGAS